MQLTRMIVGVALLAWTSWAQVAPVKGIVQAPWPNSKGADRSITVVLKIYNEGVGGTLLHQERQTVEVDDAGIFLAPLSASAAARLSGQNAKLFGEVSVQGGIFAAAVEGRQQILGVRAEFGTQATIFIPTSTTLCYTCGGAWPVFQGSWNVPYALNNVTSRGGACYGAPVARTDTRPYLCGRD
jgi:hypothetical protein